RTVPELHGSRGKHFNTGHYNLRRRRRSTSRRQKSSYPPRLVNYCLALPTVQPLLRLLHPPFIQRRPPIPAHSTVCFTCNYHSFSTFSCTVFGSKPRGSISATPSVSGTTWK